MGRSPKVRRFRLKSGCPVGAADRGFVFATSGTLARRAYLKKAGSREKA